MGEDILIAGKVLAKPIEPISASKGCKAPFSIHFPAQRIPKNTVGPIPDGLR